MKKRKTSNDETVQTLLSWTEAQKTTERLAAAFLKLEGYSAITPSHPLGGRDTGIDISCEKDNKNFIAAISFPNGQQKFSAIKTKFGSDLAKAKKHSPDSFLFITNQRLTMKERGVLRNLDKNLAVVIYDLETIAASLSTPVGYGVRLEYLGIEMSKEEQLAYFTAKDAEIDNQAQTLKELIETLGKVQGLPDVSPARLLEFKNTLELITSDRNNLYGYGGAMIDRLKVPLSDLHEFTQKLQEVMYSHNFSPDGKHILDKFQIPLQELKEFIYILQEMFGWHFSVYNQNPLDRLKVPLEDLKEFRAQLDALFQRYNLNWGNELNKQLYVPTDDATIYLEKLERILELRKPEYFGAADKLSIPTSEIDAYNRKLDETIVKLREIELLNIRLNSSTHNPQL